MGLSHSLRNFLQWNPLKVVSTVPCHQHFAILHLNIFRCFEPLPTLPTVLTGLYYLLEGLFSECKSNGMEYVMSHVIWYYILWPSMCIKHMYRSRFPVPICHCFILTRNLERLATQEKRAVAKHREGSNNTTTFTYQRGKQKNMRKGFCLSVYLSENNERLWMCTSLHGYAETALRSFFCSAPFRFFL